MSSSAREIFCMREPVMFQTVVVFTKLPGEEELYGWHVVYSEHSSGVSSLDHIAKLCHSFNFKIN